MTAGFRSRVVVKCLAPLALVLFCASCRSSEEEAARLFEVGQQQEQAGDATAAATSYRDALRLDSENLDVRRSLAALLAARENLPAARSEYLALREREPDDPGVNLALAEVALAQLDLEAAADFLAVPLAKDPASAGTRAASAALNFYRADARGDDAAQKAALADAQAALKEAPENFTARRIVIQSLMHGPDPEAALPDIEAELKTRPKSLELNLMKLYVLGKREDDAARVAQLKAMYRDFPGNTDVEGWLTDWHLQSGTPAETIAFLRDLAARHGEDRDEHRRIVQYIVDHMPAQEAAAELGRIGQSYPKGTVDDLYLAREAVLRFDAGDKTGAIQILRGVLADRPDTPEAAGPMTYLARMLHETGKSGEAVRLADRAARTDPRRADTQVLRATWAMEAKNYTAAINTLRQALDAAPNDVEALMLLGRAYVADGRTALAQEIFAKAVNASGNAPPQSIEFARFLLHLGDRTGAERVISASRIAHPDDAALTKFIADQKLTGVAP